MDHSFVEYKCRSCLYSEVWHTVDKTLRYKGYRQDPMEMKDDSIKLEKKAQKPWEV